MTEVRRADWHSEQDRETLRLLRHEVFVQEQQVPEALEWTGDDGDCLHALAFDAAGQAVGTGRLDPDGHIGRMAVRRAGRGAGVGRALLDFLVAEARRRGDREVHLNAQTHALGFYQRAGFEAYGAEFMEAGIGHRAMLKRLA